MVEAARHPGEDRLDKIFGPGARDLVLSGDAAVDTKRLDDFLALAAKGTTVLDGPNATRVLAFGPQNWPFPVPLKQASGQWTFDLAAGRDEIIARAIGRNETIAIGACGDFVAAQREYFSSTHDGDPIPQYARRFISTPGMQDGLYWQPVSSADRSPLGDRIADAGIDASAPSERPRPYNGYVYRILTRQGPAAPGGAIDYMVGDRLLAGFAMLAYPARWQETGVMTFLCSQNGSVYEANLGPKTEKLASQIRSFNPKGWRRVGEDF
ncbi:hypothetical protein GCM10007301_28000 [Azorhizobium oxalatiphilum]|uniref:DUF2950 domain-containing protein n=1 Tax=Azorhizobium oxalatiphilum TaxID=980631 RepID=A0A917C3S2_9HYPH|nr:hypothetical protein GCM10007301_28000 [Azorhizobium oxalatiphilum]